MDNMYDVIIVGGGPSGLTAAIYLARAKYRVAVLEKDDFGGQITITSEVVNYPGVAKTTGRELTNTMKEQALSFNATLINAEVLKIDIKEDIKVIETTRGVLKAFGILIATGAQPRKIGFIGEEEHKGRGISYCATCDGEFYSGKEVFVIGGGYAAAEESVFLTKYAKHVSVLVKTDDFTCAKTLSDITKNHPQITVITNVEVLEVRGEKGINYIRYINNKTNKEEEYQSEQSFGVFVFAGYSPKSDLVKDIVKLDTDGYIITDRFQKTNIDGIYASGDVCVKSLRQVVTAVGDGALAATELEKYASSMQNKTGIIPKISKETIKERKISKEDNLFDEKILNQLEMVFSKMEDNLVLKLYLNETKLANELLNYCQKLVDLTDKLTIEIMKDEEEFTPVVKIYKNNSYTGLAFHGVPGGHEFTSFIIGIYNASSKGQQIDERLEKKIKEINKKIDIKIFVSLNCTMCPDLVIATQKIASLNPNIIAEVYDIACYHEIKEKYDIMSVPCLLVNDTKLSFGKKNINEVYDLIVE